MDARHIITKLRLKQDPTRDELIWFANGLADQTVSDAQAAAFAMAVVLNGLSEGGRVDLTLAMRDSGECLSWDLDGPILDKHSTGGVGDCVSLVLAPLLAAVGVYVPMVSGRGLGHTGGTLDKLEAIPGVRVDLDQREFASIVRSCGCAIASASAKIAPADKRLYAIRDVTATVESIDLITASILSKKLAAGLDGLVLDVKCGTGAFMKSRAEAKAVAEALVQTANSAGCPTSAIITDMNEPVAPAIGNVLEIHEVMNVLTGKASGRLRDLSLELGATLFANTRQFDDTSAMAALTQALDSGVAAEKFGKMVSLMGGPVNFVENWQRYLTEASTIQEVLAPQDGYIAGWNGEALGLCVVGLGGGRQKDGDTIDPAVGLSDVLRLGSKVKKGEVIARVHASRFESAQLAQTQIKAAVMIGEKPDHNPLVIEKVT